MGHEEEGHIIWRGCRKGETHDGEKGRLKKRKMEGRAGKKGG